MTAPQAFQRAGVFVVGDGDTVRELRDSEAWVATSAAATVEVRR